MAAFAQYDWIFALITIALCASSFGNGANDVANSYATSVAARTLTLAQVGVLAAITEFVGAVALGRGVTDTVKNGIIDIDHFKSDPAVLILVFACAEFGSASWLIIATKIGFPVSTTQTVVGALVGAGIASRAGISWSWDSGGVAQVAASWGVAPCLAACIAAILFATLKYSILERENSFQKAMKAIPFYLAFTAGVLALFIVIEAPVVGGLEALGAGAAVGIILGVFFGVLLISYVFFIPYFKLRLIRQDPRVRPWHIPLGPLLLRENPPLYFPGTDNAVVTDYYASAMTADNNNNSQRDPKADLKDSQEKPNSNDGVLNKDDAGAHQQQGPANSNSTHDNAHAPSLEDVERGHVKGFKRLPEPEERWLKPVSHLFILHPRRLWAILKYILLQGISRDCVSHSSEALADVHSRAKHYDLRVEHLWTYAQVASAMMMSIAHGSNDVANAIGPWVGAYMTWQSGEVSDETDIPIWILIAAALLLGAGFWFMGFHIIRSLGNKLTQVSPTRGYAMELGAAITVLLASSLDLPVSTTQCLTGAVIGVSLMNMDLKATNWKQFIFIFCGWVLTLPCAGLIAGLLTVMALNTPQFGQG
jgi:phosphate/sulfate permease